MRSTDRGLLAALPVCTPATTICAQVGRTSSPDAHAENVAQPDGEAPAVDPADDLTEIEVLPTLGVIAGDRGIATTSLTLENDEAMAGVYGVNIELPLVRFDNPFGSATGLSDVNDRGRRQFNAGPGTGSVREFPPRQARTSLWAGPQ